MRRVLMGFAVLLVLGVGSCALLVPERFAVNAPFLSMLFGVSAAPPEEDQIDARLRVPAGLSISLYADGLPATARSLRFTERGDLLVSTPRSGGVVLLEADADGDGRANGMREVIAGLNRPYGVELRDGWLYLAETDAIGRIRFDAGTGRTEGAYERVLTGLPADGNHWTKTLRFGPDGWLYFHVGSSCNVCIEADDRRATIMRVRADGSQPEVVGTGLRNSVGFDWQPSTGHMYATDNGRDLLGDDFPPCELNRIQLGSFYGWPLANGNRVPDPDFGAGRESEIAASTPPAHAFRAHNAPLGMTFLRGTHWPAEYRGAAIVALHGSWNRTTKDGYKVVSLHWLPDGSIEERDFAVGFEVDGDVIGRPVDVVEGPDGAIYVSDDYTNVVWRIALGAQQTPAARREAGARDPLAGIAAAEREELAGRGRSLYRQHACATCHEQAAAPPGTAVKPLAELGRRYTVPDVELLLDTPPPPMPIYPLSAADRRALAVYVLTLP